MILSTKLRESTDKGLSHILSEFLYGIGCCSASFPGPSLYIATLLDALCRRFSSSFTRWPFWVFPDARSRVQLENRMFRKGQDRKKKRGIEKQRKRMEHDKRSIMSFRSFFSSFLLFLSSIQSWDSNSVVPVPDPGKRRIASCLTHRETFDEERGEEIRVQWMLVQATIKNGRRWTQQSCCNSHAFEQS